MNSILTIARFEWHYHQRRPVTYLFALLILGQGFWYTTSMRQLYAGSDASAIVYLVLASPGVALVLVAILLAGQSLTKDQEYRAAPYLYTLPVASQTYFAGRFLGAYITSLTVATFYPLGTLLPLLIYPVQTNPFPWLVLIDGFVRLIVENVFITVSLAFSLTVFTRNIRGAFIALFIMVLHVLLADTRPTTASLSDLWLLLDPFGVGMSRESVETMQQTDIAGNLFVFSDMLLINRLLWLGLALGLLKQAEGAFSYQRFGQLPAGTRQRRVEAPQPTSVPVPQRLVRQSFDGWSRLRLLGRLAKLEFLTLVRQPVFQLTAGLLVMLTVLLATTFSQNPNFPDLPLTSHMTALRLPIGAFICLFLLVMSGELFFQERTVGLWSIFDALPQPGFVLIVAKWLAMTGMAGLLTVVLFLTGVTIQLSNDFWAIDWRLYALDLIIDGWLRYCQWIVLGGFVAVLVNNRFVSHLVSLLVFLASWLVYQSSVSEGGLSLYSFLPGSERYSELTGYGASDFIRPVAHAMWWGLAGLFGTLALLLWHRGAPAKLVDRIRMGWRRFSWSYGLVLLVFTAIFCAGLWRIRNNKLVPPTAINRSGTAAIYTKLIAAMSISGKRIPIEITYHHPYQVRHIADAAQSALRRGEHIFGAYPHASLQIIEMPHSQNSVRSSPGRVLLSEKEGWTADHRQPAELDYIDYLISREVFNQWIVHRMRPARKPGDGFLHQSLAEYLALRVVADQYGPDRLKRRLAQRTTLYMTSRSRTDTPEKSLLQSSGNDALERGRAALVLTSIGQVWGDSSLSRRIGQFYRQAVRKPTSATANAFAARLTEQLPDSLRYLTTYLRDRLEFDFSIGRIANLPNGLTVEIMPKKWRDDVQGRRRPIPVNDYIPLAVVDADGRELYRALVHPNPDERFVQLPLLPSAAAVVIDPLGTWPEPNKRDNRKVF